MQKKNFNYFNFKKTLAVSMLFNNVVYHGTLQTKFC